MITHDTFRDFLLTDVNLHLRIHVVVKGARPLHHVERLTSSSGHVTGELAAAGMITGSRVSRAKIRSLSPTSNRHVTLIKRMRQRF